jgi:hypothetical protein
MKKISYFEAKDKITEFVKQNYPDFYNHEEFEAAITHWMHNPGQCPPVMPKELFLKLLALFSD